MLAIDQLPAIRLGMLNSVTDAGSFPSPARVVSESPLHRAARLGDHEEIRSLVTAGAEIDEPLDVRTDPGAWPIFATPLGSAAGSCDGATADTCQLLLDLGASLGTPQNCVPPVWYACGGIGGGDADRVRVLLRAGADMSWTMKRRVNDTGQSLLAIAAETGDAERVRVLLQAGADPEPAGITWSFEWPLSQAVESGSAEVVSLLLEAGADVRRPLMRFADPLLGLATSSAMVQVLLDHGATLEATCEEGANSYRPEWGAAYVLRDLAVAEGADPAERLAMLRLVKARLEVDADLLRDALRHAVFSTQPDAVEALLAVGATALAEDRLLDSACFGAEFEPNRDIERVIDLLVDHGIDPNDEDESGFRPLHTALSPDTFGSGYQESDGFNAPAALALLRRGAHADITYPTTDIVSLEGHVVSGMSSLHVAALAGAGDVTEALLAAGADWSALLPDGTSALSIARSTLAALTIEIDELSEPINDAATPWELEMAAEQQRRNEYLLQQARDCVTALERALADG